MLKKFKILKCILRRIKFELKANILTLVLGKRVDFCKKMNFDNNRVLEKSSSHISRTLFE